MALSRPNLSTSRSVEVDAVTRQELADHRKRLLDDYDRELEDLNDMEHRCRLQRAKVRGIAKKAHGISRLMNQLGVQGEPDWWEAARSGHDRMDEILGVFDPTVLTEPRFIAPDPYWQGFMDARLLEQIRDEEDQDGDAGATGDGERTGGDESVGAPDEAPEAVGHSAPAEADAQGAPAQGTPALSGDGGGGASEEAALEVDLADE